MRILVLVIVLVSALACATGPPPTLYNMNPDWNPPGGFPQADAECNSRKLSTPGLSFSPLSPAGFSALQRSNQVYYACMRAFGYLWKRDERG